MKQFFKFMFASMLGTFLVFLIAGVMFFFFLALLVSGLEREKTETIPSHSVLVVKLDYPLSERSSPNPFSGFSLSSLQISRKAGLNEVLRNIRKAKSDSDIDGIYLDLNDFMPGGMASIEAVRRELGDFKKSGKFVLAFGDNISQGAYYLGSVADKIYLNPAGNLDFKGLSAEMYFFKKTLDKLEIEAQIFQYGKYKSATEPYRLDKMSNENRTQMAALLGSIYNNMLKNIEASRHIPFNELNRVADNLLIQRPEDARKYNFIDSLVYYDQVYEILRSITHAPKKEKVSLVSLEEYSDVATGSNNSSRNKIAVIYAVGEILNTDGSERTIGNKNISEAIRQARSDDNVKAIVMRVNSPGGYALVADEIWREVSLTHGKKTFIISMGNYAASGGYYISCAADTIVAEPTTITGSIGVFGIIPNFEGFLKNKLGVTSDRVKTGKFSDLGSTSRPFNKEEKAIIQREIDRVYETFVNKVAKGRKKTFAQINDIAQGHVWTGLQAKELGLVDVIGGLDDAIKIAASKAKIKNYYVTEFPRQKGFFRSIVEDFSTGTEETIIKEKLGSGFRFYNELENVKNMEGVQTRLPFILDVY
ncbi:MAG: signal peptide peptidase SppA [Ignavibacteria bacterium]|jgi:protease-4|nr:signal peptide peptidase SppA [Ignavibacteria bacterium]MCU7520959.1 signal peptide peptidase SppA [Ignavibacteria bacterium]